MHTNMLSRIMSSSRLTRSSNSEPTTLASDTIVESITCPITGDIMRDPVQGTDGHTYERSAIEEWLRRNPTSPQTREPMQITTLKVNASIRFLCDKYHAGEFGNALPTSRPPPKVSTDSIKLSHSTSTNDAKTKIMASFTVDSDTFPKEMEHLSQDVVLVIDRSGSMQQSVEAKDASGNQLENGFSIQDIVNHAAKTVAKTLDKNSRLAIIIFDNAIEILFDLKIMNDMNQSYAITMIDTIKPRGQTNIYHAIEAAIDMLDKRDDKTRNGAILMLTDGIPNISPARGELETLKRLRIKKNFTSPIYTFGFGYNLQRELLYDIAKYCNGVNGHIPDGGMIATVFCNFISNILNTVAVNLQVHIKTPGVTLAGDYASNYDPTFETTTYDVGCLQNQQSRDIIFNTPSSDTKVSYFFTYKICGASYKSEDFTVSTSNIPVNAEINYHDMRYHTVEHIRSIINYKKLNDSVNVDATFEKLNRLLSENNDHMVNNLIKNVSSDGTNDGQVKLAITNSQYYTKWGEYYLDQLSRSLNQQFKPNFKDEGCNFGGDVFNDIVDKASDIFDTLPPPVPSNISRVNNNMYHGIGSMAPPPTPVSMSVFNDPNGGCFTGDSVILLANGDKKLVKDLVKGDRVMTLRDPYGLKTGLSNASVVCILKTITTGNVNLVTTPKGLKITPWHPIITRGIWCHPGNVFETKVEPCNEIYTILLDKDFTFNLNGHWVIGIGHNYKIGILAHEYFGTNNIVQDLMSFPTWDTGIVTISSSQYLRDCYTNDITGITKRFSNPQSHIMSSHISNQQIMLTA